MSAGQLGVAIDVNTLAWGLAAGFGGLSLILIWLWIVLPILHDRIDRRQVRRDDFRLREILARKAIDDIANASMLEMWRIAERHTRFDDPPSREES
jgi:hypothetical protein